MSGSTIGGIVGGVIGFYIGGPTGAQYGWMIGSLVGGVVDPQVIKGPQLTDPQQQTASEGAPIPLIYGTYAVIGTIIQCQSEPTEHKHKDSGKGGPVQETYTYTRTVAIAICRAAPLGGEMLLRRAWVNGKLAYDATGSGSIDADSAKFLAGMTFYSGSETQMPDPDLEALPTEDGGGVGNVPAYRGLCYAVLPACDVTESGGAVPVIKWEVVSSGTQTTSDTNHNWIATNRFGKFQTSNGTDWTTNATYTLSGINVYDLQYSHGILVGSKPNNTYYSTDKGASFFNSTIASGAGVEDGRHGTVVDGRFLIANSPNYSYSSDGASFTTVTIPTPNGTPDCIAGIGSILVAGGLDGHVDSSSNDFATSTMYSPAGIAYQISAIGSNGFRICFAQATTQRTFYTENGTTFTETSGLDSVTDPKSINYGNNVWVCGGVGGIDYSPDNGATWVAATIPATFLCNDARYGGGLWVAVGYRSPNPVVMTSVDGINWTERTSNFSSTDALVSVAYMPCDGYSIPDAPGWYVHRDGTLCGEDSNVVTQDAIDLESIVGDLTDRAGVSDYDVSALDGIPVLGFAITQPTNASACLQELQKVYFWDYPEWGNSGETFPKLRAVLRGGNSAVTLTDDDIVDVDDDEDTRRQLAEFPRKVNFIAPDPDHDYEPITQSAERESENVTSTSEVTISTAVAFTRDMAAPIADKMLRVACEEAQGQIKRTVPEEFTANTTSDIVTYGGRRYRIDMIDAQDGQSTWTLTRDRASAYESNATGSTGVTIPDPVSSLRGPTIGLAMNLPSLRSSDNVPGMYLAACGLLAGWQGCDVYLSVDGGTTEQVVATIIDPATMGWLTADLDSSDVLSVQLYNDDELDDATDDQLAARMNACAVLSSDVAEILQFKDATDTGTKTYDLETLTRGELGTVEVNHSTDDDFVLLDGAVKFLPLDVSLSGKELIFRFVTRGTTPANNDTITVTFDPPTFVIDGGGA